MNRARRSDPAAAPAAPPAPAAPSLQRDLTERLLLSTLHEVEASERAETSLAHSEFLAEAAMMVGMSLNSSVTRDAIAAVTLPVLGTWCVVDLIESDGTYSRLPIMHRDPLKQALLRELSRHWKPESGDPFGVPAIDRDTTQLLITDNIDAVLEQSAHSPLNLQLLRQLDIGSLLTMPMICGDRLLGAITFVSEKSGQPYSPEEIRLARNLADRNAEALEHARIHTEALLEREQAELASLNKLRFLGHISHELRTPLNAIMGYVEVMSEEIHGPITPAQQDDLTRIRLNQEHLLKLVNDLLIFVQAGTQRVNQIVPLDADALVAAAVMLIDNMLSKKSLRYEHVSYSSDLRVLGDQERVSQILVNLLANAIKYTPRGGRITTRCDADDARVHIRVVDTGIGIDASKLEDIFEPFVQVASAHSADGGVGLGLAISRDLARGMHGDLSVESTRGRGSCFTLTLPRAR
ncbi:MAG TPA: GAF domain-containing sensor histidine kinase [Longimicrobiales bacterium]|nr:GAF domain-containing sensor histidine kinase [Longimicrobiales bacterium]